MPAVGAQHLGSCGLASVPAEPGGTSRRGRWALLVFLWAYMSLEARSPEPSRGRTGARFCELFSPTLLAPGLKEPWFLTTFQSPGLGTSPQFFLKLFTSSATWVFFPPRICSLIPLSIRKIGTNDPSVLPLLKGHRSISRPPWYLLGKLRMFLESWCLSYCEVLCRRALLGAEEGHLKDLLVLMLAVCLTDKREPTK